MTPKQKAEQLVDKYLDEIPANTNTEFNAFAELDLSCSKRCALIAVDEIIQALDDVLFPNPFRQYWEEVKKEIEKL